MKCAIMQPTYLPWAGYFNLMKNVDCFILLDDVQFNKRSWQQRNRILVHGKEKMLTIPVHTKGKRNQKINDVVLDDEQKWLDSHLAILKSAYSKHPFGKEIIEIYSDAVKPEFTLLKEVNMAFIEVVKSYLNISTELIFSSDLPVEGKKSEYLINICDYLGVKNYLSPLGSYDYIQEEGLFNKTLINVEYQNYNPQEYSQKYSKIFTPSLSIIDVLANIGCKETIQYI
ncbi:WbqC family protein [Viridibacillus arvi]|uniref:WbqC family protein n=1 Tax=Viridibacillus arvi TaxID=263475 RepID=UPI003D2D3B8F